MDESKETSNSNEFCVFDIIYETKYGIRSKENTGKKRGT